MPFPDCSVNNSLIKTVPLLDALPQFFHVLDLFLVNAILQNPTYCINDGVYIRAVGRPQRGQNKVLASFASADLRSTRVRCAGAPSSWKVKYTVLRIFVSNFPR